ncbi:MAG TPA: polysaccharide deacetylase family protein [Dongiaceae bacterium]|nr:polysaccharide deacetylase family protein [Dongiaceae bacterium]
MRVLSPLLNQVVYPVLGRAGYFSSRTSAAVITYHGVLPQGYRSSDHFLDASLLTTETFRSQLLLLKRNYNVISPGTFREWLRGTLDVPERAVLLTCDDGLLNNLTVMLPLLRQYDLQCLFFVTGASLDADALMLWYIELYLMMMEGREGDAEAEFCGVRVPRLKDAPHEKRIQWLNLVSTLSLLDACQRLEFLEEAGRVWGVAAGWRRRYLDDSVSRQRFQVLDQAQVEELGAAGMTIGAHTLSHPELSRQPAELAAREVMVCRHKLKECAGQPVWAFAFPFGNPATVGDRDLRLAEEAGYECAFMNIPGPLSRTNKFALPRIHVTSEMSLGVFEAHVSGFHESLRRLLY